jgi:hypothetical protein
MNTETAEPALQAARPPAADATVGLPSGPSGAAGRSPWRRMWGAAPRPRPRQRLAQLRADSARMTAVRESWRALWSSRALAWTAGLGAVAMFGFGPARGAFDPPGVTRGFGWLGDLLAAPVARWDSDWFLVIARYGYRPDLAALGTATRQAYFPVYPLSIRAIGTLGVPLVIAGVLVSLAAFALALYGIHRLTTLELGRVKVIAEGPRASEAARLAVLVVAFSPMAFFFSAVYSESLFLALSVGLFWCARHGRWRWVALLGALAGATRSTGLVLALPALIIYLYGPREDRAPDFPAPDSPAAPGAAAHTLGRARGWAVRLRTRLLPLLARLRPRYRLRRDILWLALLPAGVVVYGVWLGLAGGDVLGPFHAEHAWNRHLVGPFASLWDALTAAFDGARQLLSFQRSHVYFTSAGGDPFVVAEHNLVGLAFLLAAFAALVGVFRRLPLAYGAYAIAAIALPLSYPVGPEPLQSIPRYIAVLFPLAIWLAAWLAERPRVRRPAFVLSALLMAYFATQFATWHWVA